MKRIFTLVVCVLSLTALLALLPAFAAEADAAPDLSVEAVNETGGDSTLNAKAYSAALVVGIASAAGAIGMAIAISKSASSIARQPEADGKIRSAMMLGLVFIETAIIYALVVAILIIFVL